MKNTRQTTENTFKNDRYIGYGPVKVVAINPNKDALLQMGFKAEEEPVYLAKDSEGIEMVYIDVYFQKTTNALDTLEFSMPIKHRFFLKKKQITSDKGSVLCINDYGNSTFIPIEHAKIKTVPENLSWFKGKYMVACEGQREFTEFLRAFFGIPNLTYKNKAGEIVTINNPSDAEVGLENWLNLFKGDFSEIKIIENYSENKLRVLFGVKTTDDNKNYQQVFYHYFGKINNTSKNQLEKQLTEAINNGRYAGVEFSLEPIHEYNQNIKPTLVKEVDTDLSEMSENPSSVENSGDSDDLPF